MALSHFVHRFVPGADPAAPSLLVLHGTGGDENDLIPIAQMVDGGSAILSPRGSVLENGMPRFFRRLAEGVFDLDDLARRTRELGEFIADASREYGFDAARLVAIGYSNGANIAASLMLTQGDVLAGAILLRPMVPFEPERVPNLRGKHVLVSASRQDPIVPPALTERLVALFEEGGADVATAWYPTGHGLSHPEIQDAARWFADRQEWRSR